MSQDPEIDALIDRAAEGDEAALAELFVRFRERLRRIVQLRLDQRLQGRVDTSDVLQETYMDLSERLPRFARDRSIPFFLWLRLVLGERLARVHRHHLGTSMRDAGREVSIHRGAMPQASSESLAAQLLGRLTSVSRAVARAEIRLKLQQCLDAMDPIDREVIVLRHFEELRNDEVAQLVGLSVSAASKRYLRALLKLKGALRNNESSL